jgi:hypothetical protein
MTGTDRDVPEAWDQLREPAPDLDMEPVEVEPGREPLEPSRVSLMGGAWGDLVAILAVCTSTFLALSILGYGADSATVPWALALGVAWWTAATAVLLVVRQGTPGMLLSGVVFEDTVPRSRVVWVVLAALALCITLGVPALLGAHASPLRLAAGVDVVSAAGLDDAPA